MVINKIRVKEHNKRYGWYSGTSIVETSIVEVLHRRYGRPEYHEIAYIEVSDDFLYFKAINPICGFRYIELPIDYEIRGDDYRFSVQDLNKWFKFFIRTLFSKDVYGYYLNLSDTSNIMPYIIDEDECYITDRTGCESQSYDYEGNVAYNEVTMSFNRGKDVEPISVKDMIEYTHKTEYHARIDLFYGFNMNTSPKDIDYYVVKPYIKQYKYFKMLYDKGYWQYSVMLLHGKPMLARKCIDMSLSKWCLYATFERHCIQQNDYIIPVSLYSPDNIWALLSSGNIKSINLGLQLLYAEVRHQNINWYG